MNPTSPKAIAGSAGAGLAGYIVVVALWILKSTPPPEVVAGLTAIIGAALTFAGAWLAPHGETKPNGNGGNPPNPAPAPTPAPAPPPVPQAPGPRPPPTGAPA